MLLKKFTRGTSDSDIRGQEEMMAGTGQIWLFKTRALSWPLSVFCPAPAVFQLPPVIKEDHPLSPSPSLCHSCPALLPDSSNATAQAHGKPVLQLASQALPQHAAYVPWAVFHLFLCSLSWLVRSQTRDWGSDLSVGAGCLGGSNTEHGHQSAWKTALWARLTLWVLSVQI